MVHGLVICGFLACAVACATLDRLRACAPRALCMILGLACGLAWSATSHERALALGVPTDVSKHAVPLVVRIASDPAPMAAAGPRATGIRFVAEVIRDRSSRQPARVHAGRRLRLAWYDPAEPVR